jgi:hypothetical protein
LSKAEKTEPKLILKGGDIEKLDELFQDPSFLSMLLRVFLRKKFDEKDFPEALFINHRITTRFEGETEKQNLIIKTLAQIIEICKIDQGFRELISGAGNPLAMVFEIINLANEGYPLSNLDEAPSASISYSAKLVQLLRKPSNFSSLILHELALTAYELTKDPEVFKGLNLVISQVCYHKLSKPDEALPEKLSDINFYTKYYYHFPSEIRSKIMFDGAIHEYPTINLKDFDPNVAMSIDPIDGILKFYSCKAKAINGELKIILSPVDDDSDNRNDFDLLVQLLFPMARCEGEVLHFIKAISSESQEEWFEINISNPESLFIYYSRLNSDFNVGSINILMNEIYRNYTIQKDFLGKDDLKYEDLVESTLAQYVFNKVTEGYLKQKLLSKGYIEAFKRCIETRSAFDLDSYLPTNSVLEATLREIFDDEPQTLRVAFYGAKRLLEEDSLTFLLHSENGRIFRFDEKPLELPDFPGIGLRVITKPSSDKTFREFYIADPILAQEGFVQLTAFFDKKRIEAEEYVTRLHQITNESLAKLKSFIIKQFSKEFTGFPTNLKDFHNELKKVKISTSQDDLVKRIIDNADKFKALTFEKKSGALFMTIKRSADLVGDVKMLEKITAEHQEYLKDLSEKAVAELELLEIDRGEKTKTKPNKTSKSTTPKPTAIATSLEKATPPTPPTIDFQKSLEDFFNKKVGSKANHIAIAEKLRIGEMPDGAKQFEIIQDGGSLIIKYFGVSVDPKLANFEGNIFPVFDEAEKTLTIQTTSGSIETSVGRIKGFLKSQIIDSKKLPIKTEPTRLRISASPQEPSAGTGESAEPTFVGTIVTEKKPKSPFPALVAETGSTPETTAAPKPEAAEIPNRFLIEAKACLQRRKEIGRFDFHLLTEFPLTNSLVLALSLAPNALESMLYGGFIYSKSPNDLDFAIVVRNDSLENGAAAEELLKSLPEELKRISRISQEVIGYEPSGKKRHAWKIKIGDVVDISCIEEKDYDTSQSWTSNVDAGYYNLRTGAIDHFFHFKQKFAEERRLKGPHLQFIINTDKADHQFYAFRFIYSTLMAGLPKFDQGADGVVAELAKNLKFKLLSDGMAFSESAHSFSLQRLLKEFNRKHPMSADDRDDFNYNVAQVVNKLIKDRSLSAEAASLKFGDVEKLEGVGKYITPSPTPSQSSASSVANCGAGKGPTSSARLY